MEGSGESAFSIAQTTLKDTHRALTSILRRFWSVSQQPDSFLLSNRLRFRSAECCTCCKRVDFRDWDTDLRVSEWSKHKQAVHRHELSSESFREVSRCDGSSLLLSRSDWDSKSSPVRLRKMWFVSLQSCVAACLELFNEIENACEDQREERQSEEREKQRGEEAALCFDRNQAGFR